MLLVPVVVMALAGCSGGDDDDRGGAATPSGTPSATAPTAATTKRPLPAAPELVDATGGTDDVGWDPASCPTAAGRQRTSGTLTNPTKRAADYVLTVSWLDEASETLARGVTLVKRARPGVETRWKVQATVPEGASTCIANVLRGTLAT